MMAERLSQLLVVLAFRLVARTLFRVRILGREHIPARGPALLVSNHLTYLDGFLIGFCLGPVVRFLVWKPYYDNRLLRWGFRLGKSIPIGTRPHSAAQAIRQARGELERGHVICIFAEGSISRTGGCFRSSADSKRSFAMLTLPLSPSTSGGCGKACSVSRVGDSLGSGCATSGI
jgi:acyl-[acyl-carrier-protein]-phospholipid O-acyltransferase / long-chain-fatty-acid--[acyl-carrier-protein] ligase